MKLFNFLKKNTNYTPQQLTDKQSLLIELVDYKLIEMHDGKFDGETVVKEIVVPLMSTVLPVSVILDKMPLEKGDGYIPRSVALVVDPMGNWRFYYSIKQMGATTDELTANLFMSALNRTNDARVA